MSGKEREIKIKLNRPTNLPTVEQTLRDTVEVMDALIQPDLTKPEGKKLLKKAKACHLYCRIFSKYVKYKKLEIEMLELAIKYQQTAA